MLYRTAAGTAFAVGAGSSVSTFGRPVVDSHSPIRPSAAITSSLFSSFICVFRLRHPALMIQLLWWVVAALMTAAMVVGMTQSGDAVLSVVWLTLLAIPTARAVFLGVQMDDERVVFRSWFRTRSFSRSQSLSFSSVPYSGFLNDENADGTGRFIEMIEVTVGGNSPIAKVYPQQFLVARRSTSRRNAVALNAWVKAAPQL